MANLNQDVAAMLAALPALDPQVAHIFAMCGVTSAITIRALRLEQINTLADLEFLRDNSFEKMASRMGSRAINRGGATLGEGSIVRLNGARFWYQRRIEQNIPTLPTVDFTHKALRAAVRELQVLDKTDDSDMKIESPGEFKPIKWVSWEAKLVNYLSGKTGPTGYPLSYVIRKDLPDGKAPPVAQTNIYQAPLHGPAFQHDDKMVHHILMGFLAQTEGHEWVKAVEALESGRATMTALCNHYDGPTAKRKRIAEAEHKLETAFYLSEAKMTFETFSSILAGAFQALQENGERYTEKKKVTLLLQKMKGAGHPQIQAAITGIRMAAALNANFLTAANTLSETISSIYPNNAKSLTKRRVAKMRRNGKHKKTGQGNQPYNRTKYPHGKQCNGVSIEDVTRYFSNDEWGKLTHEVCSWLHNHTDRVAFIAQKDARKIQAARALIAREDGTAAMPPAAAITTTTAASTTSSVTNATGNTRAGARFGRSAYNTNTNTNN